MNVLLFGATGMVGDGVLHVCLADERVREVLALVRSPIGIQHPKLRELEHTDFFEYSQLRSEFARTDACFFCLGVSSAGMGEAEYTRLTHDLTLAAARALAKARPGATFCYVSGEGTDLSSRSMWARVKGRTETALLQLSLEAYLFRPGFIRPRRGKQSKTPLYRIGYLLLSPAFPLLRRLAPRHVTTAENVGLAMVAVAERGYDRRVLENADINSLGGGA